METHKSIGFLLYNGGAVTVSTASLVKHTVNHCVNILSYFNFYEQIPLNVRSHRGHLFMLVLSNNFLSKVQELIFYWVPQGDIHLHNSNNCNNTTKILQQKYLQ